MSGQQATITRADTTGARYSTVRMLVPWSQGEQTSIATIRSTRAVQVGATTYPTRWRVRGAPHNDGSIRFTYAEWFMEVANGNLSSGAPTHTATVVAAANNPSAASFAAWADQLSINIAYTSETGSSVSTDIAALARGGTNGSIYTVSDEGGTRFITYDVWIGPGRRHEPKRSLYNQFRNTRGPSVGNNVVLRNGLLHVVAKLEVRDQEDHMLVELSFRNDAGYPYPSAPPDGGERTPGQPARPTQLNPAATNPITGTTEQLESRLFRQFVNGITVTISHASTTVYSRPFYVANHTTGAGPFGTITSTGNGTTLLPIRGLADGQCWGIRFAVSDVSTTEAAFWASHAAYGWIAVPTYATWLATERTRTFTAGEVAGDTANRPGWIFPVPDTISDTTLTAWRLRGHAAGSVNFMNQTIASPWKTAPYGDGDRADPNRGGKHWSIGWLHHGEAMLAGSPEFAYKFGGWALRESSCRTEQYEIDALESIDYLTDTTGQNDYTIYFAGTRNHETSWNPLGRRYGGSGSTNSPVANFNGTTADRTNPDPEVPTSTSGPNWGPWGHTHVGMEAVMQHALLTDSALDRYNLAVWANTTTLSLPMRTFFPSGPRAGGLSSRGELRPPRVGKQYFLLEDDATKRNRIRNQVCARMVGWLTPGSNSYWSTLGGGENGNAFSGSPCGIPPFNIVIDTMHQWWLIGQVVETAMEWAMDAPTDAAASTIAEAVMYLTRYCVDFGFWVDPTNANVPAAAQRQFDTCFAANAARLTGQAYPIEGYLIPKHSRHLHVQGTSNPRALVIQNVHADVGVSNDAQAHQQWPCLPLSMVFAANRARGGHTDRVAFLMQGVGARFTEMASGEGYADDVRQHLGFFTGASYRPATQGQPPRATFTVSTRTGTIPLEVTLDPSASTINGNTALASYRWWDNYIAGANPTATGTGVPGTRTITYNGPGLYRPALEITQEDSQVHLYVDPIGIDARQAVILAPIPRFTATPSTVLTGATVQFSYIELGGRALTRVWEYKISTEPTTWTTFGAGATDPLWTAPVTAGTYDFRVTATNESAPGGVTHTELALVRVNAPVPPPTAYFDPSVTIGVEPLAVAFSGAGSRFTGAASAVRWEWWRNYSPAVAADSDVTGTAGSSYSTTYTVPGVYYPGLRVTQADLQSHVYVFGPGIVVQAIPATRAPIPDFTVSATTVTAGDPLTFTYIDGPSGGRALSYVWSYKLTTSDTWINFSTERSPQWTSPDVPGIYDFRVIATNEASETGTKERLGLVIVTAALPAPVPTFTATPSYGGLATEIAFDAAASTYSGFASATQWEWFQDASEEVPTVTYDGIGGNEWTYTYTSAGTYYPALRLTQEDGQFATFVYTPGIVISQTPISDPPDPDFTASPTTITSGGTVQFTYIERGPRATSYVWEYRIESPGPGAWTAFGSGAVNPVWTAPVTTGLYSFRVAATNEIGSTTKTRTSIVTVNPASPAPQATFATPDQTDGVAPLIVNFDASASVLGGTLAAASWAWYANSSQGSPTQTIVGITGDTWANTYSSAGTYYPMLVLTQSDGQTSTYIYTPGIIVSSVAPVESPPFPRFRGTPVQVDGGNEVVFTYVEAGIRALTYSWEWKLGSDGAWTEFATTKNSSWTAPDVQGVYDIRVTATNEYGSGVRTRNQYITVRSPAPEATFVPDETSGQYPLTVVFDASGSTVYGDPAVATWDWYATSSDTEPTETITGATGDEWTHEYELPGVYTPMLVLTQEDGQESRFIYAQGIVVTTDPGTDPPAGTITASASEVDPGDEPVLTWNDSGVRATSHVWYWSDDGSTWVEFSRLNPATWQAPETAGAYSFRCEATNQNGTTTVDAEDLITVSAGSPPVAAFSTSQSHFLPTAPLYPRPFVTLTNESTGATSYRWRVDPDALEFTDETPAAFQLSGKGQHRITLTAFNAFGEDETFKIVSVQQGRQRVVVRDPKNIRNRRESEGT